MPFKVAKVKSNCCNFDVKVVPENARPGQTCYYQCLDCGQPCDPVETMMGMNVVYRDHQPVVTPEMVDRLTVNLIEQVKKAKRETEVEVATNICTLIDEIELNDLDSTLQEWRQYKRIRNAIRDFYGI